MPHDDASSTGLSALFQLCWGLSTLGPYGTGPCVTGVKNVRAQNSAGDHVDRDENKLDEFPALQVEDVECTHLVSGEHGAAATA